MHQIVLLWAEEGVPVVGQVERTTIDDRSSQSGLVGERKKRREKRIGEKGKERRKKVF